MQLLLLSNSRSPDGAYLTYALDHIQRVTAGATRALFIPFAGVTIGWDEYTMNVQKALQPIGLDVTGAHTTDASAVKQAELIIVGGGNTFQLLKECRERGFLDAIASRVRDGAPYIGWSAGSNLACPTICTTNDMPIVNPGGFDALGLVNFQINPHYNNALPPGHQGETRNQRIAEYLAANPDATVVGLPEGNWMEVEGSSATYQGPHTGYLFRVNAEPQEITAGTVLG